MSKLGKEYYEDYTKEFVVIESTENWKLFINVNIDPRDGEFNDPKKVSRSYFDGMMEELKGLLKLISIPESGLIIMFKEDKYEVHFSQVDISKKELCIYFWQM